MKLTVGIITFLLCSFVLRAQDSYVFESASIELPEINQYQKEVYLSQELCLKLAQFNELYTQKIDRTRQNTMPATEILKPDLYYAICRLKDYYCKCLKKGILEQQEAEKRLQSVLEKSMQLISQDTRLLEAELRLSSKPKDIAGIFEKIIIK
ncbi:MAG: hypothetical protein AB7D05_00075 [Mangrovibacterium sp.]